MIRRTLLPLLVLLAFAPAAFAAPVDYFAKKQQLYDQWEKVMHQYPIGPEREAAFRRYVTEPLGRMDPGRINDFQQACQDAGVAYDKKLFSAGSPPWSKSFKKGGDLDTQTGTIQEFYRLRRAAIKRGLKVTDNGNSFSIESHEVTVHMPPSPYSSPTSRGPYEGALKADAEAAEGVAQSGGTSIPTSRGTVRLDQNLIRTPTVAAGDYYKKAHEARDFLKGGQVGRQRVIESLNFSNKAEYKMAQEMRKAGLNPGMAIHRKSLAELDAQLGNRTGADAEAYARQVNDRTFQRMGKMTSKAAARTASDVARVRKQIAAAEKAGDVRKAMALRQQLNNTRQQVKRVAEMSGRRELVRRIMDDADDAADAAGGSRGARFLQKLSEKFEKVTPALKKMGRVLVKGLSYGARAAELYALNKELEAAREREAAWARKIGRDPSYGGIAKEFLFGALGFHRAKEKTDAALARQGKSDKDILSWEYLKTFVAVEAYQVLDGLSPFPQDGPTVRIAKYLEDNPEVARQMLGQKVAPGPQPPPRAPAAPPTPPPMVAASMPEKGQAKEGAAALPDLPPMVLASMGKDGKGAMKKPDPKAQDDPPPPMVTSQPEKKKSKPKPKPKPKPSPAPEKVYTGFNPGKKYTIKAIALETEPRVCRTGASFSETFNGVVQGSEMSVIVRQDGQDHVISGDKAQYLLVRKGYIRNQKNCGYVTTRQYDTFGPGITQAGNEGPQKSYNECVEQYCPGCAQSHLLGVALARRNPDFDSGETVDTYCADCLDQNRSRINACAGQ